MPQTVSMRSRIGFESSQLQRLYRLLYPHFHCRVIIPEEIEGPEPVVFCCNHYESFGPLAVVESLPFRFHLWMNEQVLHPLEHMDELLPGICACVPHLPEKQVRDTYLAVSPIAERAFHSLEPIPSSLQSPYTAVESVRLSAQYLMQGDSIVIFPESGVPCYPDGGISPLFQGFTLIGELMRREGADPARFCPVYIDRFKRVMTIGHPLEYPDLPAAAAGSQLAAGIEDALVRMAVQAGNMEMPEQTEQKEENKKEAHSHGGHLFH